MNPEVVHRPHEHDVSRAEQLLGPDVHGPYRRDDGGGIEAEGAQRVSRGGDADRPVGAGPDHPQLRPGEQEGGQSPERLADEHVDSAGAGKRRRQLGVGERAAEHNDGAHDPREQEQGDVVDPLGDARRRAGGAGWAGGLKGADIGFANYTLTVPALGAYFEQVEVCSPGGCHMLHCRSITRLGTLLVLAAGCRTSRAYDRANDPGGRPLSPTTTGSLIITGRALSADPSRTVLDVIRHAMPQLRITGWTPYTRCPLLELRGKDSLAGSNDPDVYVDGTRTTDTCPLVHIPAAGTV